MKFGLIRLRQRAAGIVGRATAALLLSGALVIATAGMAFASNPTSWFTSQKTSNNVTQASGGNGNFSISVTGGGQFQGWLYLGPGNWYKCKGVKNKYYKPNSTGPLCTSVRATTVEHANQLSGSDQNAKLWHPYP
ncbi:MAG: hypothetical protein ACRDNS_19495 [Trebonia sp.]